jgi:hypothetical protein
MFLFLLERWVTIIIAIVADVKPVTFITTTTTTNLFQKHLL